MGKFLELRKSYRMSMKTLESCLHIEAEENDNYLPETVDWNRIKRRLYNEDIRSLLNNARTGYEYLGIRLGGEVSVKWLKGLTPLEKKVFLLRFKHKKGFIVIAEILGVNPREVQKSFKTALNKVMKNMD